MYSLFNLLEGRSGRDRNAKLVRYCYENYEKLFSFLPDSKKPLIINNKIKLLGCGSYGCAFLSKDQKSIIKITHDLKEGEIFRMMEKLNIKSDVLVKYYGGRRFVIKTSKGQGRFEIYVRDFVEQYKGDDDDFNLFLDNISSVTRWMSLENLSNEEKKIIKLIYPSLDKNHKMSDFIKRKRDENEDIMNYAYAIKFYIEIILKKTNSPRVEAFRIGLQKIAEKGFYFLDLNQGNIGVKNGKYLP